MVSSDDEYDPVAAEMPPQKKQKKSVAFADEIALTIEAEQPQATPEIDPEDKPTDKAEEPDSEPQESSEEPQRPSEEPEEASDNLEKSSDKPQVDAADPIEQQLAEAEARAEKESKEAEPKEAESKEQPASKEEPESKEEPASKENTDDPDPVDTSDEVNVPLFNAVMQFFLEGPLMQQPEFIELQPADKEYVVLKAYNDSNGTDVKVKLNFGATTSYNKSHMKANEQYYPEVPINPFCLRPDITIKASEKEQREWDEYNSADDSLASGRGDNYPPGSRLFIGNLAVNSLSKEDVYRIFRAYGDIKQVNLKQGFGFIQYGTCEECERAIKGEQNVPLHNKMMHLEVSKHQVQRALEKENSVASLPKNASRLRNRSPSPRRSSSDNDSVRSRSPLRSTVPEAKIILTTSASPEFNEKVVGRFKSEGVAVQSVTSEEDVDNVPQEEINDAAYDGVLAVILTNADDKVNVMLFEKDSEGGIKFDEYADLALRPATDLVVSAKAKRHGNSRSGSTSTPASRGRRERMSPPPASLPTAPRGRGMPSRRMPREPQAIANARASTGSSRKDRRKKYPQPYYPSQDTQAPPPASQPYAVYNSQLQAAPAPPPGSHQPYGTQMAFRPPQSFGGQGYPQQAQTYGQPYGQQQNPNTQTMLSLVQQLQQNNANQQQLMSVLQQFQGAQSAPGSAGSQQSYQMQQPTQLPQQPPQMPQASSTNNASMLSNLLGQLQSSNPGRNLPPPGSSSNAANSHSNDSQDQTGDLFETLARLKNNM